jgi:hypothetical protein
MAFYTWLTGTTPREDGGVYLWRLGA